MVPSNGKMDLLVFDLDGTLVDSRDDIACSINHALKSLNLPGLPAEKIIAYVGHGVSNLILSVLSEVEGGEGTSGTRSKHFDKALARFRRYYSEHLLDCTMLYPGVLEALAGLEGIRKAVVTNKPTDYSVRILEGLGVRAHFGMVMGGDFGGTKKPAPDAILSVMAECSAAPESTMIVGDSPMDIESGRGAHVKTCAVLYGFGKREDLLRAEPDYAIERIMELVEIIGG